jgi:hypothetical protein
MRAVLLLSSFFCLAIFRATAVEPASPNDQALFLAGLPVRESPLTPLSLSNAWAEHATSFDAAWAKLQKRQLAPIGAWSAEFPGDIVRDPELAARARWVDDNVNRPLDHLQRR